MAFGSLLHTLFERFARGLIDAREKPVFDTHWPRLHELLAQLVEEIQQRIPPPNESALKRQLDHLIRTARVFLKEEEQQADARARVFGSRDRYAKLWPAYRVDTVEPVPVTLPGGMTFLARGIVTVDRSTARKRISSPCGITKQAVPEIQASRSLPAGAGDSTFVVPGVGKPAAPDIVSNARVAPAIFPNVKERGERRQWTPGNSRKRVNILFNLCELISTVYVFADRPNK